MPKITWPATKLPAIRKPIDKNLIIQLNISIQTIRGVNHRGVPKGMKPDKKFINQILREEKMILEEEEKQPKIKLKPSKVLPTNQTYSVSENFLVRQPRRKSQVIKAIVGFSNHQ